MILASCINNNAGPGAKGAHAAISLAEGGIRFALHSSSLISVFHMVSSSAGSGLRTVPASPAYMPPTAPAEATSYTLQGLIAWKDILRSLETRYAPPGSWEVSRISKTCTAHPAQLLFHQVLLFVVGHLLAPHPRTNALDAPIRAPYYTPSKQPKEMTVPHIVITPPTLSHPESVNAVPTPQNAAFGNQLIVPDPEFTVINCWKSPVDLFTDALKGDEFSSVADDPYGGFGGSPSPSWGDPDDVVESTSWEEREIDDASMLGLGPTWSG